MQNLQNDFFLYRIGTLGYLPCEYVSNIFLISNIFNLSIGAWVSTYNVVKVSKN